LKPGASYELRGAREATLQADDRGVASFEVDLRGRTPLHLEPRG